ncbi:MAG: enoyl-CoA hydratase-related protein [Cytophagales bacterium]|nr:enoyl-CoA hydratase-related protein [Cytophagales bacterium]
MSNYKNLVTAQDNGILTVTINRPEKMNALNSITLAELKTCIEDAYDAAAIKGIIVTGAGNKAFVAGADISEFTELNELNGRKFSERGQEIYSLIENCPKPVIAVVNGYALGGGCELSMACHIRIGTGNAFFGQPEVSLGILPAYGGTQRLTHLVGKGKALELMMTGEMLGADDALSLRLINHLVTTKEEGLEKAKEILLRVFKNAPLSIGMVINCVNATYSKDEDGYQFEANSFANCCKTEDFKEGTTAFLEKRAPEFKGA